MNKKISSRAVAMTAMLGAVASVLMLVEFPIPILIPSFIKMDFSDLPALIASFSLGPWAGATVCLIKNIVHLPFSGSGGVGNLANFLMAVAFVLPAGYLYRLKKDRVGALCGSLAGAGISALLSFPINLLITYPFYAATMAPMEAIIGAYRAILPSVDSLEACLVVFNIPFTFVKGLLVTLLTFWVYKPLSRFIKGKA